MDAPDGHPAMPVEAIGSMGRRLSIATMFPAVTGGRSCETNETMKRSSASAQKEKTFDGYLAALSADKRESLEKVRKAIRAAAPKAEECISYGVPAFRLNGKFLVALAAAANHCSFFPGSAVQDFEAELKGYETSKGTVRFQTNKPLPSSLVRKLVKARISKGGFNEKA
jgi:uncharacterized protein YdhG (YjbR/CyaY superfamily)